MTSITEAKTIIYPPMILNITGEAMAGLVRSWETEVCWCSLKLQTQAQKGKKNHETVKQIYIGEVLQ